MTAPPARANIADNPSRATAKAAFGALWDYVTERLGGGSGSASAAEKVAARIALDAARELQPISASVASNALTLTLNPTTLEFRSATLGSGTVNTRAVATAISMVVSSGSTLGTASATASRLAVLALDNAGTVELAVVNADGGFHFDEAQLISTTAEGGAGAADSASVIYSSSARTNVAFRFVGYVESTQTTAGTWATAPSRIQGAGGRLKKFEMGGSQLGVAVTLAGQTAVDFNNIPAWANEIDIMLSDYSTNGTSNPIVQLGDPGDVENAGYLGGIAASATTNNSTGFLLSNTTASGNVFSTQMRLRRMDGNRWSSMVITHAAGVRTYYGVGDKLLSDVLTRIRLTTVLAVDQFDLGLVNISVKP